MFTLSIFTWWFSLLLCQFNYSLWLLLLKLTQCYFLFCILSHCLHTHLHLILLSHFNYSLFLLLDLFLFFVTFSYFVCSYSVTFTIAPWLWPLILLHYLFFSLFPSSITVFTETIQCCFPRKDIPDTIYMMLCYSISLVFCLLLSLCFCDLTDGCSYINFSDVLVIMMWYFF